MRTRFQRKDHSRNETWTGRQAPHYSIGVYTQPFHVAYEASCGYGEYFELLKPLAESVTVAHPGKLHVIFRSSKKNDRNDARMLAKLLHAGFLPKVHVPTANVRAWREMIVFRNRTVEKRTRAKNGIRCLLRSLLIQSPRSLWSRKGMAWLQSLELSNAMHIVKRDMLVAEIEHLDQQIRLIEKQLETFSSNQPMVTLLRTIPGVGIRTAEAVAAYLDDPKRFQNSKQIGAYFGLVPKQDQSGNTNRLGRINREGPAVKSSWTLHFSAVPTAPPSAAQSGFFRKFGDWETSVSVWSPLYTYCPDAFTKSAEEPQSDWRLHQRDAGSWRAFWRRLESGIARIAGRA